MYVIMIKGGNILTTAIIIAIMLLTQGKHSLDKLVMLTIYSYYKNFCEHRHDVKLGINLGKPDLSFWRVF